MITYLWLRQTMEDTYDCNDLILSFILMPFITLLDILFIIFQPLMYLLYKAWKEKNEEE